MQGSSLDMELDMYAGQFARYGAGYVCREVHKKLTPHKNNKELLLRTGRLRREYSL